MKLERTTTLVLALSVSVAIGACATAAGGQQQQARAERSESAIARHEKTLPGQYSCRFEARDETLDNASCDINGGGDSLKLSMSGGDHRLSGNLSATDSGFRFVGEYTCAAGDECKEQIETDFFEQTKGQYQGMIALENGKLLSVTMEKR